MAIPRKAEQIIREQVSIEIGKRLESLGIDAEQRGFLVAAAMTALRDLTPKYIKISGTRNL